VSPDLCRLHYREAVTGCAACHRGVCTECRQAGDLCPFCARQVEEDAALARERRRSRIALRRAGVFLHSERGDPVILREGPFRLLVPLLGGAATAFAAALVCAEVERRLGLDAALAALLCAAVVGVCVRILLGGVSRTAGVIAAALCVGAAAAGRWWAGAYVERSGAGPGLRPLSDWVLTHGAVVPALYALAALLAYGAAAGHRVA
jgi:hypothetical protein